jgi:hypothetical protein
MYHKGDQAALGAKGRLDFYWCWGGLRTSSPCRKCFRCLSCTAAERTQVRDRRNKYRAFNKQQANGPAVYLTPVLLVWSGTVSVSFCLRFYLVSHNLVAIENAMLS